MDPRLSPRMTENAAKTSSSSAQAGDPREGNKNPATLGTSRVPREDSANPVILGASRGSKGLVGIQGPDCRRCCVLAANTLECRPFRPPLSETPHHAGKAVPTQSPWHYGAHRDSCRRHHLPDHGLHHFRQPDDDG